MEITELQMIGLRKEFLAEQGIDPKRAARMIDPKRRATLSAAFLQWLADKGFTNGDDRKWSTFCG